MRPPTALTIAGSDSGGGAGIQADLKTFLDHRVYGMSVVTAVTAQNTRGVRGVWPVPVAGVRAQLAAVFEDLPVDAVKIGMLGDAATIGAVADVLEGLTMRPPIVLDPVMLAKGGAALLDPAAVGALRARLVPLATLVTPNLPEAAVLGEIGGAVLLKGGHAEGAEVVDRLVFSGGTREWRHPRVVSRNTHGTGCTLAAAIAAWLAKGATLEEACERAIAYVAGLVAGAAVERVGGGHGPLLHGLGHG
jgi:hydroxymethylpyrimidine/phosphomethylpyrimidine kinase